TFFMRALINEIPEEKRNTPIVVTAGRREQNAYRLLEQRLGEADYLAGPQFTGADIMMMFNLTSLPLFGGRSIDDLPNVQAYVKQVSARPAYVKAMAIAGPSAKRPA
ncbi:MAG: glutathione S-transferase family protein, partial [Solirubrobacteraceae bacterium]